jgi:protein arginine kinase activator
MNSLAGIDRCNTCGSSFNDIVKGGHIGCSDCYEKFSDKLEPSIRKIHGKTKHIGKFISYDESEDKKEHKKPEAKKEVNQIDALNEQLKVAIEEQRFEDAAVLRDKIKDLRAGNNE